jgi:hypothetical protein
MPGQPIVEGKAAIRAYVAASFSNPVFKIHWKSSKVTFSPGRLDPAGQWRCVVDISNEEPGGDSKKG